MILREVRLSDVGRRAVAWRAARSYDQSREHLIAKLTEELGEVARAVIGDVEGRPGRGDVRQEAAQVVILLAALIEAHYPKGSGASLFDDVLAEMDRLGA